MTEIAITSRFSGGNVEVIEASSPSAVRLRIRPDGRAKHFQWFDFRVTGARGVPLGLALENASEASYAAGWQGYRAVASVDGADWVRVPTRYDDGRLVIEHTPSSDWIEYAYFAPYSLERHAALIARSARQGARIESLGQSLEGRTIELLRIGEREPDKPVIWIVARQHPGETMAEWLVDGLLGRLLGADDLGRDLVSRAAFYIVPNMNPDGTERGHLRTNAAGANLNREWNTASRDRSPEIYEVQRRMGQTGVSLCLDVHGDETIPYCFISGADGVSGLDPRLLELRDRYAERLARSSPDFQTEHGYPKAKPGQANLSLCTNWVAKTFGAVSMTLEQPFKDAENHPDPVRGFSPERSRALGVAQLEALEAVLDELPRGGSAR